MNIKCSVCAKKLKELGGLVFSPPRGSVVTKYHLCVSCYDDWFGDFDLGRDEVDEVDDEDNRKGKRKQS